MVKTNSKETNKKEKLMNTIKIAALSVAAIVGMIVAYPTMLEQQQAKRIDEDIAATDKIVSVVEIAMANQDIYDEVLQYTIKENKAHYNSDATMNGVTITFSSDLNNGKYVSYPPQAIINQLIGDNTQLRAVEKLNNYLQQNIGDEIEFKHYTNNDYTVFIKMGETKNDVHVWGEFEPMETVE